MGYRSKTLDLLEADYGQPRSTPIVGYQTRTLIAIDEAEQVDEAFDGIKKAWAGYRGHRAGYASGNDLIGKLKGAYHGAKAAYQAKGAQLDREAKFKRIGREVAKRRATLAGQNVVKGDIAKTLSKKSKKSGTQSDNFDIRAASREARGVPVARAVTSKVRTPVSSFAPETPKDDPSGGPGPGGFGGGGGDKPKPPEPVAPPTPAKLPEPVPGPTVNVKPKPLIRPANANRPETPGTTGKFGPAPAGTAIGKPSAAKTAPGKTVARTPAAAAAAPTSSSLPAPTMVQKPIKTPIKKETRVAGSDATKTSLGAPVKFAADRLKRSRTTRAIDGTDEPKDHMTSKPYGADDDKPKKPADSKGNQVKNRLQKTVGLTRGAGQRTPGQKKATPMRLPTSRQLAPQGSTSRTSNVVSQFARRFKKANN